MIDQPMHFHIANPSIPDVSQYHSFIRAIAFHFLSLENDQVGGAYSLTHISHGNEVLSPTGGGAPGIMNPVIGLTRRSEPNPIPLLYPGCPSLLPYNHTHRLIA